MAANGKQVKLDKAICPHCGKTVYVRLEISPFRVLGLVAEDGSTTSKGTDIEAIYAFWNQQGVITHRRMTNDMAKAIKSSLKEYTDAEICEAIRNYAEIQKGKQYYFNYAWTLKDFLKRGVPKFLDFEVAKRNYMVRGVTSKPTETVKAFYSTTAEDSNMLRKYRNGEVTHEALLDYVERRREERERGKP